MPDLTTLERTRPPTVVTFAASAEPALLQRCQALRYRVYHHDLGLETPDLDHGRRLDVEVRDGRCDFAAVLDAAGEVVGCVRMQPPGRGAVYAEDEFELLGPSWEVDPFVEGARFAVAPGERDGPTPLLLFQAFRQYCRAAGVARFVSVLIVRGEAKDRAAVAALTRHLIERCAFAPGLGRPAPGYALEPPSREELAAAASLSGDAAGDSAREQLSPMVRLLANRRSTLASQPAYCRRFGTFNFLLSTRLARP